MTQISEFSAAGVEQGRSRYTYDVFNQRIAKTVDLNVHDAIAPTTTHFVYDRAHVTLDFSRGA